MLYSRAARQTFFLFHIPLNKLMKKIYSWYVSSLRVQLARDTAVSLDKRIIDDYQGLLQLESYNSTNYSAPLHLTMMRKLRLIKRKIPRAMRDISERDIVKEIIIACKRHNEIYDSCIRERMPISRN